MALGEPEPRERLDLLVDRVGIRTVDTVLRHPREELVARQSIRSMPRLEPIARRSVSASSPVQPPTAIAICMSCSWKIGTPSVRLSDFLELGVQVGDRLLLQLAAHERVHGATLDGPGRIGAISTTRS